MKKEQIKMAILLTLNESTEEIELLLNSLGYKLIKIFHQKLDKPDSRTYIGKGKTEEISQYISNNKNISMVAVNGVLQPNQHYNLEKILKITVFDRLRVILEIFMIRAHNKEAILQVELAKYQYELPFVREWIHSAVSGEHPGFMAGGGYQTDQYLEYIRRRIKKIKNEINKINKQKEIKRHKRHESGVFTVSIAGYTNVGKSSLLNSLTLSNVTVANDLFTTLDTTTRRLKDNIKKFYNNKTIVLTDTIGLINQIPPWMIYSFKSTLDEIKYSNCILLMLDINDDVNIIIDKFKLSENLLRNDNDNDSPPGLIILLNKIDLSNEIEINNKINTLKNHTESKIIPISVTKNIGLDILIDHLIKITQSYNLHEK